MRPRPGTKLVLAGLGLVVGVCLWLYLAPVGLGGSTSYVVTHGTSMEPRFHTGDLALVRARGEYRVGEVVAYRSHVFHTVVLHRIIGRAGSRYIFKGDNNNFVDFEHPARSQLIGALWAHVPGAGATLQSLRSPALTGALVGLGFFLLTGVALTRRRRRRKRERRTGSAPQRPRRMPVALARGQRGKLDPGVLAVGSVVAVPFLLLALLAFTRASTSQAPFTFPYKQTGALSYSAGATPGPTYPSGRVTTGEPLFTHLVSRLSLRFEYALHSEGSRALDGRAWIGAGISSSSGWTSTLRLAPTTRFRGDHTVVGARLSLPALLSLMDSVEKTTAVNGSYILTIEPHVRVAGQLQSQPVHASFSPKVKFTVNPLEVRALSTSGSAFLPGQPGANPFTPSTSASLTGKRTEPLYLSLGPVELQVATARWIALGGVLFVTVVLLSVAMLLQPRRRDAAADILARYGRLIVPVERVRQLPGVAVIDVADMDALARIAERYDRSILHERTDDGDAFWVTDESGQFRYLARFPPETLDGVASEAWRASPEPAARPAPSAPFAPSEPAEMPVGPVTAVSQRPAQAEWATPPPAPQAPVGPRGANGDELDWTAYHVARAIAAEGHSWGEAGEAADASLYEQ